MNDIDFATVNYQKYVDFVIVDKFGTKALYRAPEFSHLKRGDKVMDDALTYDVIASGSFIADETKTPTKMVLDTFDYTSIENVPKLTAKVNFVNFKY